MKPWGLGVVGVFVGRAVVTVVANALTHGDAATQAENFKPQDARGAALALLVLATVVIDPFVEELLCRGVLLRAFMRRMPFWPAAVISTIIFAGFHVYEVDTVVGGVVLALEIGVLSLVNCYLVRITGRLAPAILTHASFNLLAVLVYINTGR